jgi:hypothetical protein
MQELLAAVLYCFITRFVGNFFNGFRSVEYYVHLNFTNSPGDDYYFSRRIL